MDSIVPEAFTSSPSDNKSQPSSNSRTIQEDTQRILAEQVPEFGFDKQEAFVRIMLDEAISKRNPRLMIALLNPTFPIWPSPGYAAGLFWH